MFLFLSTLPLPAGVMIVTCEVHIHASTSTQLARWLWTLSSLVTTMSIPLLLPSKHFYYPVGNTAAVCLTRDVAPERDSSLLLLGCGDPRNILCTVHADGPACKPTASSLAPVYNMFEVNRKLDFTTVDNDPGVLCRFSLGESF